MIGLSCGKKKYLVREEDFLKLLTITNYFPKVNSLVSQFYVKYINKPTDKL